MLNFLKCMLQLILSPVYGWEDISFDGRDRKELLRRGLIPMLMVAAGSVFVQLCYRPELHTTSAVISSIVTLISLTAGYFIAAFLFPILIPDCTDGEYNDLRCSSFIIYAYGLLSLITIVRNVLPIDAGITIFLPLYEAIILWKGATYVGVKSGKSIRFVAIAIGTTMLPPYLLGLLFNILT